MLIKIFNFFQTIFSYFSIHTQSEETEEVVQKDIFVVSEQSIEENRKEVEKKINLAKRTLMAKLYELEQDVLAFQKDFPIESQKFLGRIDEIKKSYQSQIEELKKLLRFEIDPEIDSVMIGEVVKLERDIEKFIESEVSFKSLSKRLQKLIRKLNILYNVSIFHSQECEKTKVRHQLENALTVSKKLAREFKTSSYILEDNQYKGKIVNLFSYIDYEMFKIAIRNSDADIKDLMNDLVLFTEFDGFLYEEAFMAFLKDEITDLEELIPLVRERDMRKAIETKTARIKEELVDADKKQNLLSNTFIWYQFLDLETILLEMVKADGNKEKAEVRLLERMEITVNEDDVIVLPSTDALLSLTSLYYKIKDTRILLMSKLVKRASKEVSYKEIYFIALILNAIDVIRESPNELWNHLQKYAEKYPYKQSDIRKKKELVLNASKKEYVFAFLLDANKTEIIKTLEELDIDFKVEEDKLLINSFYFNEMPNVLAGLQVSNY